MYFNDKDAVKYGVEEAIIIQNIRFWLQKNRANGKHFHDGRYWTYNSKPAFAKLFPFWSEKQIRRILDSLRKQGVLVVGNYNPNPYDKTLWYSFSDQSMIDEWKEQAGADSPESPLCRPKSPSRTDQTGRSITDINTDIKTNISPPHAEEDAHPPVKKKESIKSPILFEKFWDTYGKKTNKAGTVREWNKLSTDDQQVAVSKVPDYVKFRPDPVYRKDPERYLKHRVFEDEILNIPKQPAFKDYV